MPLIKAMSNDAPPIPMAPLISVRNAPSRKNCRRMLRLVAPRALRKPISRVRSLTATSMMLMIPMAPRVRVTKPTPPRKISITSKILPTASAFLTVSQSSKASSLRQSNP